MTSESAIPKFKVRYSGELDEYDLVIAALGYEERCTFIGEKLHTISTTSLAIAFQDRHSEQFDVNRSRFDSLGFEIVDCADEEVGGVVFDQLNSSSLAGRIRLAVDISSFTRLRLFSILKSLLKAGRTRRIDVDFWYAPSLPPIAQSERPTLITSASPLDPSLAGWNADPSKPLAAIVGVGIEKDLALGVAEHLDVARVWAFVPTGVDEIYDSLAAAANAEFFVEDYISRQSSYDLASPLDLYTRLESLIFGVSRENRVVLVPLGPKVFALASLLLAMNSDGAVGVWRFSEGQMGEIVEAKAAGMAVSFPITIEPETETETDTAAE